MNYLVAKINKILAFIVIIFILNACDNKKGGGTSKEINYEVKNVIDSSSIMKIKEVSYDTLLTGIADFIGGIKISKKLSNIEIDSIFWNNLKKETDKNFNKTSETRLTNISNWNINDFIGNNSDSLTVFYPFSGPDFLHVNYLYPNTKTFVLLAIEKIGNIPDFETKGARFTEKYLKDINNFMRDIYLRGYFITSHMKTDLKETSNNGLLGSLYWFISRTEHKIINQEFITLDENGRIIKENSINEGWLESQYDGVSFKLLDKNGKEKKLIYFSGDISNKGLTKKNPELKTYLNNLGQVNTFVKAASYLMHYNSFDQIRNIVLDKSYSVFQDDTGVPYRFYKPETFDVSLFGRYRDPIKDFASTMDIITQEGLRQDYKKKDLNKGSLPFSLGYHYRNRKNQNQQLAVKKN